MSDVLDLDFETSDTEPPPPDPSPEQPKDKDTHASTINPDDMSTLVRRTPRGCVD